MDRDHRSFAVIGETGCGTERVECDIRMARSFCGQRQPPVGRTPLRVGGTESTLRSDDIHEQRLADLHRAPFDGRLGRFAAPSDDPLGKSRPGSVERERTHRVGDRNRVTPLLDDVRGSAVHSPTATHRQPFVRSEADEIVAEAHRVSVDDHQVAELCFPGQGEREVRPFEHPAGELPVHRRPEH